MANQHVEEQRKFHDLLTRFDTGMLITHTGSMGLHARPMAVAQVEDNCDLWFLTGLDSPKIDEIRYNDNVLVTFQNKRDEFITLSGRAELVRNADKIDELWHESFKVWFPQGQTDPNLVLLHVRTEQGEFWDNTGANKLSYMLESLRAYASGDTPNIQEGTHHGKLNL